MQNTATLMSQQFIMIGANDIGEIYVVVVYMVRVVL